MESLKCSAKAALGGRAKIYLLTDDWVLALMTFCSCAGSNVIALFFVASHRIAWESAKGLFSPINWERSPLAPATPNASCLRHSPLAQNIARELASVPAGYRDCFPNAAKLLAINEACVFWNLEPDSRAGFPQ